MTSLPLSTAVKVYRMVTPDHECPWGLRAIHLLTEQGITFEDIPLTSSETVAAFKNQYQVATTPQIFFGETRIGGYTDLAKYLAVKAEKADYSYTPVVARICHRHLNGHCHDFRVNRTDGNFPIHVSVSEIDGYQC